MYFENEHSQSRVFDYVCLFIYMWADVRMHRDRYAHNASTRISAYCLQQSAYSTVRCRHAGPYVARFRGYDKSPLRRTPVSFNTLVVILANVLMNLIWTKTRASRLPISEDQIITFIRFSTWRTDRITAARTAFRIVKGKRKTKWYIVLQCTVICLWLAERGHVTC